MRGQLPSSSCANIGPPTWQSGGASSQETPEPTGTVQGRIRITEQGEVIAAKYGTRELAHANLESIVSAEFIDDEIEAAHEALAIGGGESRFALAALRSESARSSP